MAPTTGTRLRFKTVQAKKVSHTKKVPSLKNRIRGLERFLSRRELSHVVRIAKEAELQQLKEEHEKKDQVAVEKENAEKYKRPRFFERVKVMRKLCQTKKCIEQANDEAQRTELETKFKKYREKMMYIFYYPKSEPYIPLFPSAPHSEENQKHQKMLQKEAISQFEKEQPIDAFHQFCFNDGKSKNLVTAKKTRSAADLLLKNSTKEMVKRQKKAHSKRNKSGEKSKHTPVLVDQEEGDEIPEAAKKEEEYEEYEEEKENDDFFL